jgi:hypothetical protein
MNNADEISQAERRRIMADERRGRTYHGVAASSVDDEKGGRYAASGSKQAIVGNSSIAYPAQPPGSPWRCDECPPEPPLGYSVDAMEAVGEPHEVEASRPGTDARPVTKSFRRRF